jgi:PAS domain S-box-containing protein
MDILLQLKPFMEFVHPDDREDTVQQLDKLSAGRKVFYFENRYKCKDGTYKIFAWNANPVEDDKIYAAARDITERKHIEEKLETSEKKLRELIETINDWIWTVDSQGTYTYVSPRVKDLLGYTPEEVLGKTPFDLMPAEEAEKIGNFFSEKVSRKESFEHLENINVHKDGRHVVLETSGTPVLDHDGTLLGYRGVDRDITERKKLEEERQKVQKLESTGLLAGGIAHDFNNILTAILGNISMAKIFAESNEEVLKSLIQAEKASMRAQGLSQQLLTFSKGGEPIKKPTRIIELIKDSASFSLTGSNVTCNLFIADNLWPVNIDEGQISQVIQNVVKNADQVMPDGGTVIIEAENKTISGNDPLLLKEGKYVWITIKDQGGGIPEKFIGKIFDPYFSTKQEGSGLGLAASFSIIIKHNGHISAESEPGEGTTFHIYLPASEKVPPVKKRAKEKSLQGGEKILIMDDDLAVLKIATQMLNMMGFITETTTNGQEAVALYKKAQKDGRPFGAVLLDLTIPGGMGGKKTVKQLVHIDPEVKAIASSGYANDPIMSDYKSFGFSSAVSKPYDIEKLGEALSVFFC